MTPTEHTRHVEDVRVDFGAPGYHLRFDQPTGPLERGPVALAIAVPDYDETLVLENEQLRAVGNGDFTAIAGPVERAYATVADGDREVFLAAVRLAAYNAYVALASRAGVALPAAPVAAGSIDPPGAASAPVAIPAAIAGTEQRSLFAAPVPAEKVAPSATDTGTGDRASLPDPPTVAASAPRPEAAIAPVPLVPGPSRAPEVAPATAPPPPPAPTGAAPAAPSGGATTNPGPENPTAPVIVARVAPSVPTPGPLLRFVAVRGPQGLTQTITVEPAGDRALVARAYAGAAAIWAALGVEVAHDWSPAAATVSRMVALRERPVEAGGTTIVVTEDRQGSARYVIATRDTPGAGAAAIAGLLAEAQAAFARPLERFIKPGGIAGKAVTPKAPATSTKVAPSTKAPAQPKRAPQARDATPSAAPSAALPPAVATPALVTTGEVVAPVAPATPAVVQRNLF
jgi:hypothetical protein